MDRRIVEALATGSRLSIQIILVCACAGLIVGVISLTGVGARFSALLLDLAAQSQLLALVFAMGISIILGMGMPTTAAYAVAASVVASVSSGSASASKAGTAPASSYS